MMLQQTSLASWCSGSWSYPACIVSITGQRSTTCGRWFQVHNEWAESDPGRRTIDFLAKWLGPGSSKIIISLRTASVGNPYKGLRLAWERLDGRVSRPEMIEAALKMWLAYFPKITNKDNRKLYDLSDLLLEIAAIKEDEKCRTLLSYFDSSSLLSTSYHMVCKRSGPCTLSDIRGNITSPSHHFGSLPSSSMRPAR